MQIRCPCPYAMTQPFHCYAQIPKEVLKPSIRRRACSLLQYLRGRELVQYGREQMSNVVEAPCHSQKGCIRGPPSITEGPLRHRTE